MAIINRKLRTLNFQEKLVAALVKKANPTSSQELSFEVDAHKSRVASTLSILQRRGIVDGIVERASFSGGQITVWWVPDEKLAAELFSQHRALVCGDTNASESVVNLGDAVEVPR